MAAAARRRRRCWHPTRGSISACMASTSRPTPAVRASAGRWPSPRAMLGGNKINIAGAAIANAEAVTSTHALDDARANAGFVFDAVTGNVAIGRIDVTALARGRRRAQCDRQCPNRALRQCGRRPYHGGLDVRRGECRRYGCGIGSGLGEDAGRRADGSSQRRYQCVGSAVPSAATLAPATMAASADAELTFGGNGHNGMNIHVVGDIVVVGSAEQFRQRPCQCAWPLQFRRCEHARAARRLDTSQRTQQPWRWRRSTAQARSTPARIHISPFTPRADKQGLASDRGDGALASANAQITQPTISIAGGVRPGRRSGQRPRVARAMPMRSPIWA